MKTREHPGRVLAELRKITGKSQSQFATMIGVSKDTIISVENGRNQLSENLANRIFWSTGVQIDRDTTLNQFRKRKFTPEKFNLWRLKTLPSSEAAALSCFEEMSPFLKALLLAAAKPGRAGNRDRFPALRVALSEWLIEMANKFKLHDELVTVLADATRHIGRQAFAISFLREDPNQARRELTQHGIDLNILEKLIRDRPSADWLIIEDEFERAWDPAGGTSFPVETRKLIPKPKLWTCSPQRLEDIAAYLRHPFAPHGELLPL